MHKVSLILEAATRLIEQDGLAALTTNAVAARAGVSIGTLYQYFADKQAILDGLTHQHVEQLTRRVRASLDGPAPPQRGDRIRAVVQAVYASHGGRRKAHRELIEHALRTRSGSAMAPLFAEVMARLADGKVETGGAQAARFTRAQAFVLSHALAGVLRGIVASEQPPPREEVEEALMRLLAGFA